MVRRSLFVACCAVIAGCPASPHLPEAAGGLGIPIVDAGSPEELGILSFLNDPATTFELLDVDVALDRRAARNLIDRRDGPDGVPDTGDDEPFTSVVDVDSVPYVGPVALQQLLDWAEDHGWIEASVGSRDAAIVGLLNDGATTFEVLDVDVALDRRAAANLIAERDGPDATFGTADDRPFTSVAQVDAVPYVGPSALDKLAAYGLTHGYGDEPVEDPTDPPDSAPCAIFSEYIEGSGNNNKAVEVYNCGTDPLALDRLGVCLVRNGDTSCTNRSGLGTGTLAPGAVWTLCRTRGGTFNDPYPTLVAACDYEIGGAAVFDGDDRLILFDDPDGDAELDDGEAILDTFGDPATRPSSTIWAEMGLRRCNLQPHAPGSFEAGGYYLQYGRGDFTHLGVPPSGDCTPGYLAAEGELCLGHEHCAPGLRCYGRPHDGSDYFGRCVDPTPLPGEGADCDRFTECAEGLICAGWTLWGEGTCNPQWMAGRFERAVDMPIDDPPAGGISPWVVVQGLASVPVDLEVVLHIDHPRPTDLRVTLIDPNGDEAVLWNHTSELASWSRSFVTTGISRDDEVNGRWSLRIEDTVAGEEGTFHSWSLFVVSRWD